MRYKLQLRWLLGMASDVLTNVRGPRFAGPPLAERFEGRALVSGATGAIGEAVCGGLAARGCAEVLIGARDAARGEAALARLAAAYPSTKFHCLVADLSASDAIERLVRDVGGGAVDLLVNNAGVMGASRDATMRVNLCAPVSLTSALLEANPSMRVVNVASSAHLRAARCSVAASLGDATVDRRLDAYAASKLGLLQFTSFLRAAGYDARACHPGLVWTPLLRDFFGPRACRLLGPFRRRLFRTPEHGAASVLLAAVDGAAAGAPPYYVDGKTRPAAPEAAEYRALADELAALGLVDAPGRRPGGG